MYVFFYKYKLWTYEVGTDKSPGKWAFLDF